MSLLPKSDSIQIREVWADNLEEEFALIRDIVDDYPYIAMDTEFPGIVLRPVGNFKNSSDYHYQTLKDNVDMLKLIQLGLTFSDEKGNLPTCETDKYCIWQFNFCEFNPNDDVFANDSIELLRQSGIDLVRNNEKGINARRFGELLMSSGIVLNDNVYWVTFHSGYDFGYLLKLLTCQNLPDTQLARWIEQAGRVVGGGESWDLPSSRFCGGIAEAEARHKFLSTSFCLEYWLKETLGDPENFCQVLYEKVGSCWAREVIVHAIVNTKTSKNPKSCSVFYTAAKSR